MDEELRVKTNQKKEKKDKEKKPSKAVGIFEQVAQLEEGAHEAFFMLSGGDSVQYEALQKMEVFTFFRYLNSKKKQYKTTVKKPRQ